MVQKYIFITLAVCLVTVWASSGADDHSTSETEVEEALLAHADTLSKSGRTHDAYAYKMPSHLWMLVRYSKAKGSDQVQEYMKIVDNIVEYLKHVEEGVRSVSLNVGGVETVLSFDKKKT